jgi:hypothetical protein
MNKFEEFKGKEKFGEDASVFYAGVSDFEQRAVLSGKMSLAAEDFKTLAETGKATEKDFQDKIEIGLLRFNDLSLDSEDRERVCHYFEELMDMVSLESSGGHLNVFIYGFDPNG